jgi:hypothetical protein
MKKQLRGTLFTSMLVGALAGSGVSCGGSDDAGFGGVSGSGTGGATGGSAGSDGSGGASGAGTGGNGTGGTGGAGTGGSGTGGSGTGGSSGPGNCGTSWVITYSITGQFTITGTPLGLGDASHDIGPGELKIRFRNEGNAPAAGPAEILSYTMPMNFSASTSGLTVTTDIVASAGPDACGVASGNLSGTTLAWETCTYTGGTDWTPEQGAAGPGCVAGYRSQGNVNCDDQSVLASCSQGGLQDGDNPQNDTGNQPLNSFAFAADLSSFQMRALGGPAGSDDKGVETPNRAPGRTWFNLNATETNRAEETTPECACP